MFTGLMASLTLASTGCGRIADLLPLAYHVSPPPHSRATINFCTDKTVAVQGLMKMAVVQDHSGSNFLNYKLKNGSIPPYYGDGTPDLATGNVSCGATACTAPNVGSYATDPFGVIRFGSDGSNPDLPLLPGTLLDFLRKAIDNTGNASKYFSLIGFDASAIAYPTSNGTPIYSQNTDDFFQYVLNTANSTWNQTNPAIPHPVTSTPAPLFPDDRGTNLTQATTDYVAALNTVYNLITNDIAASAAAPVKTLSSYIVVFMSDGSPIVLNKPVAGTTCDFTFCATHADPSYTTFCGASMGVLNYFCKESNASILQIISSLVNLANVYSDTVSGINFYTVYYFYNGSNVGYPVNIDGQGQALLQQMAKTGHGTFQNLSAGSNLDYTSFIPQGKLSKFSLADISVTNSSLTWWNDGKPLHPNSSPNGLPDDIALAWGVPDPSVHDTIGDGVSDFVKYRIYYPKYSTFASLPSYCSPSNYYYSSPCPGVTDPYQGACSGIPRTTEPNSGDTLFLSQENKNWYNECIARGSPNCASLLQNRGLNDCEKTLLTFGNTNLNGPDANGDMISDTLEFKNFVLFGPGAKSAYSYSRFSDGLTDSEKIKYSLPTLYSISDFFNYARPTYRYSVTSTSDLQTCYSYQIDDLPTTSTSSTDEIRVEIVLKDQAYQNRYLYKTGIKKLDSNSQQVIFNDWNNTDEQNLGTWSVWP